MKETLPGRSLVSGLYRGVFPKGGSHEAEVFAGVWLHLHLDGTGHAVDGRDAIAFEPNQAQLIVEAEPRPMTISAKAQDKLNAVTLYSRSLRLVALPK